MCRLTAVHRLQEHQRARQEIQHHAAGSSDTSESPVISLPIEDDLSQGPCSDADELVTVPVPRGHLAAVYEALAVAQTHRVPATVGAEWTRDEVVRLKHTVKNATVRLLLDLAAQRDGAWVTFHELWQAVGRTKHQVAADLAGPTALIRRRLGKPAGRWPLEVDWGSSAGTPRGVETRYRMSLEVAEWWRVC